jgi:hypothetical protein
MQSAGKIRAVAATAAATAALAVPVAIAQAEAESLAAPTPGVPLEAPAPAAAPEAPVETPTEVEPPVKQGTTLAPPPAEPSEPSQPAKPSEPSEAAEPSKPAEPKTPAEPKKPSQPAKQSEPANGGLDAGAGKGQQAAAAAPETAPAGGATTTPLQPTFAIPALPDSSCAISGVPPVLIPIYHRASEAYGLGPQGPAILAGINAIETAFGTNLGPSYAGAVGWMQFMPETWAAYGVDANGDGVKDPNNPEDAIYAAARYLQASGMPDDVYGAIFAYNPADWYVEDVLENAGCYADEVGGSHGALALAPQLQVFRCEPAGDWKDQIPEDYLNAFETAAARYELGKRGIWTLAAVARLESDFGRGMNKRQLRTAGALGLDPMEWSNYAVDGDNDGRLRHGDIDDSAATLARLIWSRGSIGAGVFTHNQASWYVDAVGREARRLEGECIVVPGDWTIVLPGSGVEEINWSNLTLSNELELHDLRTGLLDQRIVALLALMTRDHQITISSLRSDHSQMTASGNVSNHFYGRAMDIAAVDGISCTDTSPSAPCAQLGLALAQLTPPLHPSELIYCFDLDGLGPAFALADHCDHIHAGFSEY